MSNNTTLPGTGEVVEDIDIGSGVKRQVVSIGDRAGNAVDAIGGLTETAPASDTASSGLNGRLQRVAQRLTSLIALLPAALTGSGNLKVALVEATAALPAGSNVIGALTANQSVNVAQINGTTPLMGAGSTGTGAARTTESGSATATLSNVSASASSVTVLASNTSRLGATIQNDSTAICYLKFGSTASTTSYTVQLPPGAYYEVPYRYNGIITGIWASANGSARVTELS